MSFGFGVGDIMAISGLALQVYTAYKDAPDDYRNISDEVNSLRIIINKAARHFESITLSSQIQQEGKEVLEGCQNVLKDLDALIKKYNALASANTSQVFRRIKLGTEDIVTLRARLTSNIVLLNSFIQRLDITITITITIEYIMLIFHRSCDVYELRVQVDKLVLRRTSSRDSLVSLPGSIRTKNVYKNFIKGLFESGVTAEMIKSNEKEIQNMLKRSDATTSSQTDVSTNADQLPEGSNSSNSETSPLPTISTEPNRNRSRFSWARPPVDFLVGPLMLDAAKAGDTKRLTSTLGFVRNINFMDDTRATALHHAASGGYNDVVQLLLTKGASIDAVDKDNNTPLHRAASDGHTSIVELLLEKGASTEVVNKDNNTPLHCAAWNGHTSTVELLLSKGASTEVVNKSNETPLHLAARYGHPSTVELLLSKGTSIDAEDKYNNTPLHHAAFSGHTSTVELLLSKGASTEVVDKSNETPLHLAAWSGHTSTVELLLSKGASIEVTNKDNDTPLHLAAQYGHYSTVELLLEKGASAEVVNKDNNTPLHRAAWNGHTSTVELLLSKGASIDATNNDNCTPLQLARKFRRNTRVVELLEKVKATNSLKAYETVSG